MRNRTLSQTRSSIWGHGRDIYAASGLRDLARGDDPRSTSPAPGSWQNTSEVEGNSMSCCMPSLLLAVPMCASLYI